MSQYSLVWRTIIGCDTCQQGAVKPAAMLVGAFQVEIGRPPYLPGRLASRLEDRCVAYAGFEPHVQNVPLLVEGRAAAVALRASRD